MSVTSARLRMRTKLLYGVTAIEISAALARAERRQHLGLSGTDCGAQASRRDSRGRARRKYCLRVWLALAGGLSELPRADVERARGPFDVSRDQPWRAG